MTFKFQSRIKTISSKNISRKARAAVTGRASRAITDGINTIQIDAADGITGSKTSSRASQISRALGRNDFTTGVRPKANINVSGGLGTGRRGTLASITDSLTGDAFKKAGVNQNSVRAGAGESDGHWGDLVITLNELTQSESSEEFEGRVAKFTVDLAVSLYETGLVAASKAIAAGVTVGTGGPGIVAGASIVGAGVTAAAAVDQFGEKVKKDLEKKYPDSAKKRKDIVTNISDAVSSLVDYVTSWWSDDADTKKKTPTLSGSPVTTKVEDQDKGGLRFTSPTARRAIAKISAEALKDLKKELSIDPVRDPNPQHKNSGPYTGASLMNAITSHGGTSTGKWGSSSVAGQITDDLATIMNVLIDSHVGTSTGDNLPII